MLGKYIVDFYCDKAKLVVELDGSQHCTHDAISNDSERTKFLEQYALSVVRIPNREIEKISMVYVNI